MPSMLKTLKTHRHTKCWFRLHHLMSIQSFREDLKESPSVCLKMLNNSSTYHHYFLPVFPPKANSCVCACLSIPILKNN